jgi:hypothetical protein
MTAFVVHHNGDFPTQKHGGSRRWCKQYAKNNLHRHCSTSLCMPLPSAASSDQQQDLSLNKNFDPEELMKKRTGNSI